MKTPKINLIAAIDENFGIGYKNQLLCHLPNDLKHFKKVTMGHCIVMGSNTYYSIGKALPGRRNIVLSHQNLGLNNVELAHSLTDLFEITKNEPSIFIIGGQKLYEQFLPLSDKIFLTKIHGKFKADCFFPDIDSTQWRITEEVLFPSDATNKFAHSFIILERNYY